MRSILNLVKKSAFWNGVYDLLFEWNRLHLPIKTTNELNIDTQNVILPLTHPFEANEDSPWNDLIFLLAYTRKQQPNRILEVGTYRARTTHALFENLPNAHITTYDIQILDSQFRKKLQSENRVLFKKSSFSQDRDFLLQQEKYDFIFIDGSHTYEDVILDTQMALEILAPRGIILWHDYRPNNIATRKLKVPEALDFLKKDLTLSIYHIQGTTCAFFQKE